MGSKKNESEFPEDTMPTKQSIEKLLPFLSVFQTPNFKAGTWITKKGVFPWLDYSAEVAEFTRLLYDSGMIVAFDWSNWTTESGAYFENPEKIETADLETIRKLFTTQVRKDRFCEGHLAEMIENGHVALLLERLEQLWNEMK